MIAIVSFDAGGAEILSSWIKRQSEPFCLVLDGPALKIFNSKLKEVETVSLASAVDEADWLLCGSSWQSNLERTAIQSFRSAGKKTVAFLDHWKNYRERFLLEGNLHLPDEIWVGDPDAEKIARNVFPGEKIILRQNPYFEDLQCAIKGMKHQSSPAGTYRVLYVCEPTSEGALLQHGDKRYWGYTEEEALQYFLKNINVLGQKTEEIIVRPHPSETKEKYEWVLQDCNLNLRIDSTRPLLAEVAAADVVVGCESMAMVVALLANKRVISCIPPGGRKCCLPQAGIEHLQSMAASPAESRLG